MERDDLATAEATATTTTTANNGDKQLHDPTAPTAQRTPLPPRPDRSHIDAVKARYSMLQLKHTDVMADRAYLMEELEAAVRKRDKLQAEADMLIEQMHTLAPHISLATNYVDLSSVESELGLLPPRIAQTATNGNDSLSKDTVAYSSAVNNEQ